MLLVMIPVSLTHFWSYLTGWRMVFLASLVYGAASSPTPEIMSWAEILCAVLLVASVPWGHVFSDIITLSVAITRRFMVIRHPWRWRQWRALRGRGQSSWPMLYGLFVGIVGIGGLINGVLHGHELVRIARDLVPFGFMLLPWLWRARIQSHPAQAVQVLALCLGVIGGLFAARYWHVTGASWAQIGSSFLIDGSQHLTGSPSLLFVAVTSIGLILLVFARVFGSQMTTINRVPPFGRSVIYGTIILGLAVAAALSWGALSLTIQRAALGLGCLALVIWSLVQARRSLIIGVIIVIAGAVLIGLGHAYLWRMVVLVWHKTLAVGDNSRLVEIVAVWQHLSGNWASIMFGHGWGALYQSPATDTVWVGYSHSLLAYALLKNGLVGMALWLAVMALWGRWLWVGKGAVLGMKGLASLIIAALAPIWIMAIFFNPFVKLFGFGLCGALAYSLRVQAK